MSYPLVIIPKLFDAVITIITLLHLSYVKVVCLNLYILYLNYYCCHFFLFSFSFSFFFFASVHPSDQKAAFAFLVLLLLTKISPANFALEQFTLEEFEWSLPGFTSVTTWVFYRAFQEMGSLA